MAEEDRLIDYVAICTLKQTSLEQKISPKKIENQHLNEYEDMKLKVKARFPEEDWEGAPFPQALPLFCLPSLDGLEASSTEESLSSSISNSSSSSTIPTLSSEANQSNTSNNNNNDNNDNKKSNSNSNIKPAVTFPFVLTQAEGHHVFATCLLHYVEQTYRIPVDNDSIKSMDNDSNKNQNDNINEQPIFITTKVIEPEALVIVSRWPLFTFFETCLKWAHDVAFNQVDNMSTRSLNIVEVFFQKIVSQILPPRAVNINLSLKCRGMDTVKNSFQRGPVQKGLPTVDDSCYHVLADHLDEHYILHILGAMIMEQKILIHGFDLGNVTKVTEALLSLLYPLEWPFVYIPLVPPSLVDYLHAPLPFIMGIHTSNFMYERVVEVMPQCLIIDLNGKKVIDPMQLRPLPGAMTWTRVHHNETIPAWPAELAAVVEFHMKESLEIIHNRAKYIDATNGNKKIVKNAICMLRSTTLAMFTSLMHDASECMRPPPPGRSVDEATCNEIFDSDTFLHRKFLTGTRMKIVNADFIQPGPIGISVVKSPTGYGVVGGGGKGVRGQALQHDIQVGDILLGVNNASVLCYSYREMIKKIVEAERPVMLTFGRIKDKYAAQQFYGVDIPKLASFASTIKTDSFTTSYMSPAKAAASNFQDRRCKGFIWSMDAESLDFMYHFCASQVFATTVEDLLYPTEKFRYDPPTKDEINHNNKYEKEDIKEKNYVYELFLECFNMLENSRHNGTDVVLDIAGNPEFFYDCSFNSNGNKNVKSSSRNAQIFNLDLSIDDDDNEKPINADVLQDQDIDVEREIVLDQIISKTDGNSTANTINSPQADCSSYKPMSGAVLTPDNETKRFKRRPTFTSIDLNKFSSPTAKSSPSFRARPSFAKRYSQYNKHLDSMWKEGRKSKLAVVTDLGSATVKGEKVMEVSENGVNSNVNDEKSSILEMNLSNEINAILEDDEDEYLSDNSAS